MKKSLIITTASLLAAASLCLIADEHFDERDDARYTTPFTVKQPLRAASTEAALYKKECAACHMAYQPAMLPKASWRSIMTGLESHFGTDATLDAADTATIAAYLDTHAADMRAGERHLAKIAASLSPDAPTQITKSRYFLKEHRKIAPHLVTQPEVKSFANCTACHSRAETGSYREREISIPNYGPWED